MFKRAKILLSYSRRSKITVALPLSAFKICIDLSALKIRDIFLNDTLPFLERYTVIIYDQTSTCTSVNTARTDLFTRKGRDIGHSRTQSPSYARSTDYKLTMRSV